jgi:hypothetical protein
MNSFAPVDPKLIDVVLKEDTGYNAARAAEDSPSAIRDACMGAARDFPKSLWIEPKDWADKARDNDKYKTWPMNYSSRYTNQGPDSHECTCHSLIQNFESARNRQRGIIFPEGPKKGFRYPECTEVGTVFLSPLSVYAEANSGQWGGANVRQVMEIACRRGILPDSVQPRDYGFKHVLQGTSGKGNSNQSGGRWISVRNFPEGWQETAKLFKPLEVIFPGSWEEAVCLVLNGLHVSVGRNGHAIPWGRWMPNDEVMAYLDSYDITRFDSKRTVQSAWRGSFAIATTTTPDDWNHPAGGTQ